MLLRTQSLQPTARHAPLGTVLRAQLVSTAQNKLRSLASCSAPSPVLFINIATGATWGGGFTWALCASAASRASTSAACLVRALVSASIVCSRSVSFLPSASSSSAMVLCATSAAPRSAAFEGSASGL